MFVSSPLVSGVTEQGLDPTPDHLDCTVILVMDVARGGRHPRHHHTLQAHQQHEEAAHTGADQDN